MDGYSNAWRVLWWAIFAAIALAALGAFFVGRAAAAGAPPSGSTSHVLQSTLTPNGAWRVDLADFTLPSRFELFLAAPAEGSPHLKIGGALPANHDVEVGFLISADSTRAVYLQGSTDLRRWALYSVPLIPGRAATLLSQAMVPGGSVQHGFKLLDGDRVRYSADAKVDESFRWYVVPIAGGRVLEEIFADGFNSGSRSAWSGQ